MGWGLEETHVASSYCTVQGLLGTGPGSGCFMGYPPPPFFLGGGGGGVCWSLAIQRLQALFFLRCC